MHFLTPHYESNCVLSIIHSYFNEKMDRGAHTKQSIEKIQLTLLNIMPKHFLKSTISINSKSVNSNDGPKLSSRLSQDKCSLNLVPNPKSSESKCIYIIFRVILETYLLFLDKQRSIGESQFIPKLAVLFLFFLIGSVIFFF